MSGPGKISPVDSLSRLGLGWLRAGLISWPSAPPDAHLASTVVTLGRGSFFSIALEIMEGVMRHCRPWPEKVHPRARRHWPTTRRANGNRRLKLLRSPDRGHRPTRATCHPAAMSKLPLGDRC